MKSMLRPLETKEERERKARKRNLIFGIMIAVVMIAGTIGWAITSREEQTQKKYGNFKFQKIENYWVTYVKIHNQNFPVSTTFLPQEVEHIKSNNVYLEKIYGKTVYFVAIKNSELQAAQELAINFYYFAKRMQLACQEKDANESFCLEKPIKSCDEAEAEELVIVLEEKPEAEIIAEGNCIMISGNETEIIKAADKVIFLVFGIIK